jgi:hypothetical protein
MSDIAFHLPRYLDAWAGPFDWSHSHCGHFALGWVERATGRPALAAMPAVSGALDWRRAVRAAGGLQAMVSSRLRCHAVGPEYSQMGDLLLFPGSVTGGALGIRLRAGAAVLREDGRVGVVSTAGAMCSWPLPMLLPEVPA